jgi:hypothetical protein
LDRLDGSIGSDLVHEPTTGTPEPVVEPLKEGLVFSDLVSTSSVLTSGNSAPQKGAYSFPRHDPHQSIAYLQVPLDH